MRAKLGLAALVACLTALPSAVAADEIRAPQARASKEHDDSRHATVQAIDRLTARLRPIQARLRDDDRLRAAERVLGLGVAAYGLLHARPQAPVTFVGTQALRMGLNRQLASIRARSGYSVEPSIERHGFAITFRRTIE